MISPEMEPFAKTGGLADVVGSLPIELKALGHDIRVIMPYYRGTRLKGLPTEVLPFPVGTYLGKGMEWCAIRVFHDYYDVPVYFVEHNAFFDREGIYHDNNMGDYYDNPLRFGFLCKIAMQLCRQLLFEVDVFHLHDWPTAVTAAFLKTWGRYDPVIGKSASLLTIHNMSYQGIYAKENVPDLGLSWDHFHRDIFESYDNLNLLKGGIFFADMVNTVSPTYSYEVRQLNHEAGLSHFLYRKGGNFVGVLNGVDYAAWSPERDPFIPANYSRHKRAGKMVCKRFLQRTFRLEEDDNIALIGTIGRFVWQKGFQLVARIIAAVLLNMRVQFIILGTGDRELEDFFRELPLRFPGQAASYIGFSNEVAHLIEAGSDFFLMPSLFEPCGLNQIYSLRYGTLPIVHATGGLEDTVWNYNEANGTGTGFKFYDANPEALYNTIGWAISTYYDRKEHLFSLIQNAMLMDFSWQKSATEYEKLYWQAILNNRERG